MLLGSGLGLPAMVVMVVMVGMPVVIAGICMLIKGRTTPQPVHHQAAAPLPAGAVLSTGGVLRK